jgi:hypothetical protein
MNRERTVNAEDLARSLAQSFLQGPIIDDRGTRMLGEELVATLDGLRVHIFSREHPPPHFRVTYAGESADFQISDCAKLVGGLKKWERTIRTWHAGHKDDLIETWNRTRPTDCPVGAYREPGR